jgi:membrane-bound lytic murein transglycosylase D
MKYLLLLLFFNNAYALTDPSAFESIYLKVEELVEKHAIDNKFNPAESALKNELVRDILDDKKNLIRPEFKISDFFKPSVNFWFSIYTQYTSQQVVVHDKTNLNLVYKIMDFSQLHQSDINIFAASQLQSRLALDNSKKIKKILYSIGRKKITALNNTEKAIYDVIVDAGAKIPKNYKKKKRFFYQLSKNVRTQTGQRDMIYKGVVNSLPFLPYIHQHFDEFKLPKELLAIAFLESSFNTEAVSRAGAAGIWQFIKYTGNLFMPKRSRYIDYRYNPFVSTIAAFHLLKENKMILRSWDLAVTAYNSGTKHLVRARRRYKKVKKINLEFILKNYKHAHLGFASKNYYSEFLALVYVLAYKDVIYPLAGVSNANYSFNPDNIKLFVTRCPITPLKIARLLKRSSPQFLKMNKQFITNKRQFSKGTIIASDINLTKRKYYKLTSEDMKKHLPKKWPNLVKKLSCR